MCADGFDANDAAVACRELGFSAFAARVDDPFEGEDVQDWWLTQLACRGNERRLLECERPAMGQGTCPSGKAASVTCGAYSLAGWSSAGNAGLIRISPENTGQIYTTRRAMVEYRSYRRPLQNAKVACRASGLPAERASYFFAEYQYSCEFDIANCNGDEEDFFSCDGYRRTYCTNNDALGARCPTVNLVGSSKSDRGDVLVYFRGEWRGVCASRWTMAEANVVCHELGYIGATAAYNDTQFGTSTSQFWLSDVQCTGEESSLADCPSAGIGSVQSTCSAATVAGVQCSRSRLALLDKETMEPTDEFEGLLALFSGEEYHVLEDSALPSSSHSLAAACSELGFEGAIGVRSSESSQFSCHWARSEGAECEEGDHSLSDCAKLLPFMRCTHRAAARLRCPTVQVHGPSTAEGDVTIHRNGEWRAICDEGWDDQDAAVVCTELGFGPAGAVTTTASAFGAHALTGYGVTNVDCEAGTTSMVNCSLTEVSTSYTCGDSLSRVAGVRCSSQQARLTSPEGRTTEGFLQFLDTSTGVWRYVSHGASRWTSEYGPMVCRSLGLPSRVARLYVRDYGLSGPLEMVSRWLSCDPLDKPDLASCIQSDLFSYLDHVSSGSSSPALYLECGDATVAPKQPHFPISGVAEVAQSNGVWRAACSAGFGPAELGAVCRAAGWTDVGALHLRNASNALTGYAAPLSCSTNSTLEECAEQGECTAAAAPEVRCGPSVFIEEGTGLAKMRVGASDVYIFSRDNEFPSEQHAYVAEALCRAAGLPADFASIAIPSTTSGSCGEGRVELPQYPRDFPRGCANASTPWDCGLRVVEGYSQSSTCTYPSGHRVRLSCPALHLVGGASGMKGDVAVSVDGEWRMVCDDGWGAGEATAVCASLGLNANATAVATTGSFFSQLSRLPGSSARYWWSSVSCSGAASSIFDCATTLGQGNCGATRAAGVRCDPPVRFAPGTIGLQDRVVNGQLMMQEGADQTLRLVGTYSSSYTYSRYLKNLLPTLAAYMGGVGAAWHSPSTDLPCGEHTQFYRLTCQHRDKNAPVGWNCHSTVSLQHSCSHHELRLVVGFPKGMPIWTSSQTSAAMGMGGRNKSVDASAVSCADSIDAVLTAASALESDRVELNCPTGCDTIGELDVRGTGIYSGASLACYAMQHALGHDVSTGWIIPHGAQYLTSEGAVRYQITSKTAVFRGEVGFGFSPVAVDFGGLRLAGGQQQENGTAYFAGSTFGSGRVGAVQVMTEAGEWRYVCGDSFGADEAATVCRQLSTAESLVDQARVLPTSPVRAEVAALTGYYVSNLDCSGVKHGSIRTCTFDTEDTMTGCSAGPAAVQCPGEGIQGSALSLSQGHTGTVAVGKETASFRVMRYSAPQVAPVLCARMGFPSAGAFAWGHRYRPGDDAESYSRYSQSMPSFSDCDATRSIRACSRLDYTTIYDFGDVRIPEERAYVFCPTARLVSDAPRGAPSPAGSARRGVAQFFEDGRWVSVCGDAGEGVAAVACGLAGFPRAGARLVKGASAATESSGDGLADLACSGDEMSLDECSGPTRSVCDAFAVVECPDPVRLEATHRAPSGAELVRSASGPVQVHYPGVGWLLPTTNAMQGMDLGTRALVSRAVCEAAGYEVEDSSLYALHSRYIDGREINRAVAFDTALYFTPGMGLRSKATMVAADTMLRLDNNHWSVMAATCVAASLSGSSNVEEGLVEYTRGGETHPVCPPADATPLVGPACRTANRPPQGSAVATVSPFVQPWPVPLDTYWSLSDGSCAAGARDLGACGVWSKVASCSQDPLAADCGPQAAPSQRVRIVDTAGKPTSAGAGFVQFKVAGRWFFLSSASYGSTPSSSLTAAMCRSMGLPSSAASVSPLQAGASVDAGLLLRSPGSMTCNDDEGAVTCVERLHSEFLTQVEDPGERPQLQWLSCPRVRVGGPRSGYQGGRMQGDVEVYHEDMWRPVCADGFGVAEAQAACRSVGEEADSAKATAGSEFGLSASTGYALQSVSCTGDEADLLLCDNSGFDFSPSAECPAGNSAGVRCGYRTRLTADHYVQITMDGVKWRYIAGTSTASRLKLSAQVLCRSMGRPHVGAYYAVRNSSMPRCEFLENFECDGSEELPSRCNYNTREADCGRNYDARLLQMACSTARIQGDRPYEGPLEVYHSAQAVWQRGCLDWVGSDTATARVVCRSLGFDDSLEATLTADSSGSTSGVDWPFRATCRGDEMDLSECTLEAVGDSETCSTRAVVKCAPMLRQVEQLGDTTSTSNGRGLVQVYTLGQWVTPSGSWGQVSGASPSVFCRALGFPGEDAVTTYDNDDSEEHTQYLDGSFTCQGTEEQPYECGGVRVRFASDRDSGWFSPVRLLCQTTRLMIGSTLRSRWRGDVEQYHDGVWKPVCDTGWDEVDAQVVCRGMGVDLSAGDVVSLRGSIFAGAPDGVYGATDVACTGSEVALDECPQSEDVSECPADRAAGVECPANVRFLEKDSLSSGSVEVFLSGSWRPYRVRPGQAPGQQTAQLMCATLGLAHDSASVSLAEDMVTGGSVEVLQLYCSGSEDSIESCGHSRSFVSEGQQVKVSCPEVRLVESADPTAGVVEQYFLGEWQAVCGSGWGEAEAEVACNALGMSVAAGAKPSTALATASTEYWLSGVDCAGVERVLGECTHTGLDDGEASCPERTRASLRCTVTPQPAAEEIRLAYTDSDGGEHTDPTVRKGMVQVRYPNSDDEPEWRYVCNNAFDSQDASVVCRQLGYSLSSPDDARFLDFTSSVRRDVLNSAESSNVRTQGYSPPDDLYWLQSTYCQGDEERLQDCPRGSSVGSSYCGDWQVAVVECLGTSTVAVVDSGETANYTLSLEQKGNASYAKGLVKVTVGEESRYVCDDAWDPVAASVVCGELGFTRRSALATVRSADAADGRVSPVYFMDNVRCEGGEAALGECAFPGWGLHNCGPEEAAGVDCWLGRKRLVNCSSEAPPLVQHLSGLADNCTANCSTLAADTQARCECECLQRKYWRARFLPLSLHRKCSAAEEHLNGTEAEVEVALEDGAACPLATVPSANFFGNASVDPLVREAEVDALREVGAMWRDWNNTRVVQELCDAVRRGFAGQMAIQLRLEAKGEEPTPLMEAAMALVRELNEEQECGELLYCSPGHYPPRASEVAEGEEATCQMCPQGTYQPIFGAVSRDSCEACPAGYASSVSGAVTADTCELCDAGSFAESGASSCSKCPQGTYSEIRGAVAESACEFCPAGTYGHRTKRSPFNESCVTCPAGKYQPAPGKLTCVACPRGSYGEEAGAVEETACKLCPAGTYSSALGLAGEDQCVKCEKGKFSSVAGQSENKCVPCSSSTVAESEGRPSACRACRPSTVCRRRNASGASPTRLSSRGRTRRAHRTHCPATAPAPRARRRQRTTRTASSATAGTTSLAPRSRSARRAHVARRRGGRA